MARPPRIQVVDGTYHVTVRGNDRRRIYRDEGDRRRFLELLADVKARSRWELFAYCLMPNHYHLLVHTLEANIAEGMKRLNGVYAQGSNRRHGRVGHLFEGRYGAKLVETDGHLLSTIRYIVRNPVRAELCPDPADWPWSSHSAMLGREAAGLLDVSTVLAYYDLSPTAALRLYREHAELPDGPEPAAAASIADPELALLFRGGDTIAALATARERGHSMRAIARHLGVNASTVSRRLAGDSMGAHRTATPGV